MKSIYGWLLAAVTCVILFGVAYTFDVNRWGWQGVISLGMIVAYVLGQFRGRLDR